MRSLVIALALVLVLPLARAADADPVPCSFMMQHASPDGFADILTCGAKRYRGISVRVQPDGRLTGVYFTEHQGKQLERAFQIYDSGQLAFVVTDKSIRGGFWAQSRGTSYELFPRGATMSIEQVDDGLLVHDAAGHTWHLLETPIDANYSSYAVVSIDGVAQKRVPIKFTERGITGLNLDAVHPFYLQYQQPDFSGIASRRTRAYRETRSIFHDEHGRTCAIANAKLFVPNPKDPNDPSDMAFGFTDDPSLETFLATACPKLDLAPLGHTEPLEQH
jgi:hypothetical protein